MLTDLITEAGKAVLELLPDKRKIMHNGHRPLRSTRTPDSVHVLGMTIEQALLDAGVARVALCASTEEAMQHLRDGRPASGRLGSCR